MWSDVARDSSSANSGMPEALPITDTHEYPYRRMVPFGDSARVSTKALPLETLEDIDTESMVPFGYSAKKGIRRSGLQWHERFP